jgi:hypothetical protein
VVCDLIESNERAEKPVLVQREETNGAPRHAVAHGTELRFRHGGWATRRAKVRAAMVRADLPAARLQRFDDCGSGAWIEQNQETGDLRVTANYCHDRFCHPCQGGRARTLRSSIEAKAKKSTRLQHVVLTLKHSPSPLSDQLDHLQNCWAKLRRNRTFKAWAKGGAAIIEHKRAANGQWHPHVHLVLEGDVPEHELSKLWRTITRDSDVVNVSQIRDVKKAAGVLAAYVTKPADSAIFEDADALLEHVASSHGRHTISTFGAWRGTPLTAHADTTDTNTPKWKAIAPLADIVSRALRGDRRCEMMWTMVKWTRGKP